MSRTIVFFGTDDFSLVTLIGLVNAGYNIAAVVTKPDSKSGRGQQLSSSSIKKFALENDIPVWQPIKVSDINDNIKSLDGDVTGVLASYGKIIPESTINLFKPGIINIHPSLLPLYRGPSPIESAIKNGDQKTGVTIMKLTTTMDSGPIYGHIIHELSGTETSPELYKTLAQAGSMALISILPAILDGSLQPTPQNDNDAVYCNLLTKDNAWLEPSKITAEKAERLVRAHLGFPKTKINILNHTVIITKSHISNSKNTPLDLEFSDGKYLSVDELIAPSGRSMSSQDFLNGYA